jgi:hypothetical protein
MRLAVRYLAQGVQGECRMGVCAAGPHLGRDPDRLHDLLGPCPFAVSELGVPSDAVRHCVTCATATAISCLVFSGRAPSAKTARLKCSKASLISGANSLRREASSGVAAG